MIRTLFCCVICIFSAILIGFCYDKKQYFRLLKDTWTTIVVGILFQIIIFSIFTKNQTAVDIISSMSIFMEKIREATIEGTKFVFGYLSGENLPFDIKQNSSAFIFAFQALPNIILVSILAAILNYTKILPYISKLLGSILRYIFKIRNSIGMVSISKIFLGQLEAPLLIKPELNLLNRFDVFVILTLSFATSSAAVMPMYSEVLKAACPNAMNHFIISSVINVISTLIISCIIFPNKDRATKLELSDYQLKYYNSLPDAISKGLADGAGAWWGIVGALIGMVALVAIINTILSYFPNINGSPVSLQRILSILMYPVSWLLNIDNKDIIGFSQILGTKVIVNEAVAFFELAKLNLSIESVQKAIYATNNFGNLSCVGITIAGLKALAPQQSHIIELSSKAFIAGFITTIFTTALAGIFL